MNHRLAMAVVALLPGLAAQGLEWKLPRLPQVPAYQPSRSFTLDGWLDHTTTWISDSSYAGSFQDNLDLHTTRLVLGAHGDLSTLGGLRYLVRAGGTLAQNSLYEQRVYTPELQGDLAWTPVRPVELGLFARYGWRRPNAFLVDSLRLRDLVLGARLALRPLRHTELSASAGNRRVLDEHESKDHRFLRGELEQRIPAWNQFLVRAWGESSWYGLADSLDFDLTRSLAGITLAGTVPGGAVVHSNSALVEREGIRRVLGVNRLRWQLGRHRLAAGAGAVEGLGARLGERGTGWDTPFAHALWLKRGLSLRGELGGGWTESREYGSGTTGKGELDLMLPVQPLPWLGLSLRELARGELFRMQDRDLVAPGAKELQREGDNLLSLAGTLFPQAPFQAGHTAEWRRHTGTPLVFSDDTLRNTLHNELWLKWRLRTLQLRLAGATVQHLVPEDPVDWERRVSAQLRWQPVRMATFNLRGVWRPRVDPLPERMWIRAFAEFEMNKLQLTADLRFVGDPARFGDTDTQAWIHVQRRLW